MPYVEAGYFADAYTEGAAAAVDSSGVELLGGGPGKPRRYVVEKGSALERMLQPPRRYQIPDEPEPEAVEFMQEQAQEVAQAPEKKSDEIEAQRLRRRMEQEGIAWREAYQEVYLQLLEESRRQEDEAVARVLVALL